ncbi:Na+/K+/2Cl- cotransporter [Sarcoptes scabiei]|nr:Na+/K+/2Cl- cotransporter [Sarcoptes scabiei]
MNCCFGSVSIKVYRCKIILLDDTELIQEIKDTYTGQDILDIVFKHLDLLETAYFGLRFTDSNNYSNWLEPRKNAIHQVKQTEPITLRFGVRFYASDPCKLREECTRYQFFLQIKQDIQQSRLPVTNELAEQLLAYIIQSELGDYDPKSHHFGYVGEFSWVQNCGSNDFENKVCDLHKKLIGQIPAVVEMQFLERIKWLDLYGCELHSVVAEDHNDYCLGLGPHGILVLKNKIKIGYYYWPRIRKVSRKGKYFMIKVIDKNNERKNYGFEMLDRLASKRIQKSCIDHQEFFKLSQDNRNLNPTISQYHKQSSLTNNHQNNLNDPLRPNPSLVRVSSKRIKSASQQKQFPESTIFGESSQNPPVNLGRYNSTPSLSQIDQYSKFENPSKKSESGLFSKSASASPLSVRSAFVARYDYGRMNYISPMRRHASSSSLRQNNPNHSTKSIDPSKKKLVRKKSNDSNKSSNRLDRKNLIDPNGSPTNSPSSTLIDPRIRKKFFPEPQMVEWAEIVDKRKHLRPTMKVIDDEISDGQRESLSNQHQNQNRRHPQCQNAIVVKNRSNHFGSNDSDSDFDLEHRKFLQKQAKNDGKNVIENRRPPNSMGSNSMIHGGVSNFSYLHQHPKSIERIEDGSDIDEKRFRNNLHSYQRRRIKSNLNLHHNNYQQQHQQQNHHPSPRVKFVPLHSTAYYSKNEDDHQNSLNSLKIDQSGSSSTKTSFKINKKSHLEMSTEL